MEEVAATNTNSKNNSNRHQSSMPAGLSITPDPESVVRTDQDPETMMNRVRDSMSTNFQWQKAFSKGDQNVNAKKR